MDYAQYIQVGIAFAFVLSLMWLLSIIMRKINEKQSGINGKDNRIKIVEQRMIDTKNKAVILRCDDKDHLVIISQNGTMVVDNDIPKPKERNKKDTSLESL